MCSIKATPYSYAHSEETMTIRADMAADAIWEAWFGKPLVKSESLAHGGVMTMTLRGNLDAALLVCLWFVWVAKLAVVVCR